MWLICRGVRSRSARLAHKAGGLIALLLTPAASTTALIVPLVPVAALFAISPASAQDAAGSHSGFTVGPTLSTLGAGAEAGFRAGPYIGLRLDANFLSFDYNRTIDSIPYKFGVNLRSGGPVLDIYPFAGGFHLTGGLRINGNGADVTATPGSSVRIGNDTFTPAQLGSLGGSLKYDRFAPYAGIGYTGRITRWFELGLDAGVLYQGRPRVDLAASGPFATNATLQADLAQEQNNLESHLSFTRWYPVLAIAALFHF
jgi:hypothetical protein